MFTGHGFDTAHTGSRRGFQGNTEQPDITGTVHVGATTQLLGETVTAHAQHAHLIIVFLAEQRHGARFTGSVNVHQFGGHCGVGQNLTIHQNLDLLTLGFTDGFTMGEVKAQIVGRHQRTFLLHMLAQHVTQGSMHQVCSGMVAHHRTATIHIHIGRHLAAHRQGAAFQLAHMHMGRLALAGIGDQEAGFTVIASHQGTGVSHLAPGFGIERRARQYHHAFFAGVKRFYRVAILVQSDNRIVVGQLFVTGEIGHRVNIQTITVVVSETARPAGTFSLCSHGGFEAVHVYSQRALTSHVSGQVRRETVGVVQVEQHLAGQHLAIELLNGAFQHFHACGKGAAKLLFFRQQGFLDAGLLAPQFRVGLTHLLDQRGHHRREERLVLPQLMAMAKRTTDDAAQHIATPFVGRNYPIADQETGRTNMVGNHAQ